LDSLPPRRTRWVITQDAFDLLLRKLDEDRDRAGERYEAARRKLVKFFELRGSDAPEEHADETLNRVARKLAEGERIENVNAYLLGVARLVLKEVFKHHLRARAAFAQLPAHELSTSRIEDDDDTSRVLRVEVAKMSEPRTDARRAVFDSARSGEAD
jgi:DNA-directed RNA polymerase specialized sigma24 family protein